MATTPEEGMASLFRNLEAKTGKSIEAWVEIARAAGIAKHKELLNYLKEEHALTYGYANQIAQKALAAPEMESAGDPELISAQFAGKKEAMRPIYDALTAQIRELGPDSEISAKKTCVSFRRSKQFALVQVFAGRLDLCIQLKDRPATDRLEATPGAMLTHRVKISTLEELDSELLNWLTEAYSRA
jgi:predicted transport protein